MKRLIRKSEKIYLKDILKPWNDPKYDMVYDTDYHNRDKAFVLYEGDFYEAKTHEQALRKAGFYYGMENEDEIHFICGSIINSTDGKQYIALYPNTSQNMDVDDAIPIIKDKYPNASVCIDQMEYIDENAYIEKVAKTEKIYDWKEVYDITVNAGGRMYCDPVGITGKKFELKSIPISSINEDYYLTLDECEIHDLDEDASVINYLMKQYKSGANIPPIILGSDYRILDGIHRMGALYELGRNTIEAFAEIESI